MTREHHIYSIPPNATPFSVILGGRTNFPNSFTQTNQPSHQKTQRKITWTLRDRATNETFCAHQDVSSDHTALYSALVSERPLIQDRVYETLCVDVPAAVSANVKSAKEQSTKSANRRGVARGTHIMTARGEVLVERLQSGDHLITRDHGMQIVRWVGSQTEKITKENAPVLFMEGAIKNARNLIVSADHLVVLKGAEAMMQYGVKEVLIPARKLVNDDTIVRAIGGEVEFFQIVTDQHEVIYCEAAANESFMPDENGIAALCADNQAQVLAALPTLATARDSYGPAARGFIDA